MREIQKRQRKHRKSRASWGMEPTSPYGTVRAGAGCTLSVRRNTLRQRQIENLRPVAAMILVFLLTSMLVFLLLRSRVCTVGASDAAELRQNKYYKSVQVSKNDTMWDIASREMDGHWIDIRDYIAEVCEINGIPEEELTAGNYIIVPYYA